MAINVNGLCKTLREQLCQNIGIDESQDGLLMLRSQFQFADGDQFTMCLSEVGPNELRLSDLGDTLMHISYDQDIEKFTTGTRGMLIEQILGESGVRQDRGVFYMDTSVEYLARAFVCFGQAITRICDLTFLSRTTARSTFYKDLSDELFRTVGKDDVEVDYSPDVPNSDLYPVDFRLRGNDKPPVFLHGVHNRDKARLTTICLSHFHRHKLEFESILVFRDQREIPRLDLARLSNVGGEMVASLDSREDLNRKLMRKVAA